MAGVCAGDAGPAVGLLTTPSWLLFVALGAVDVVRFADRFTFCHSAAEIK
jgi:hypothetical protein